MNIELLRKIQRGILEHPDGFDMGHWADPNSKVPGCGTTACIAGWACVLARGANFSESVRAISKAEWLIPEIARMHLGLTLPQSQRLFHMAYWPDKYFTKYRQLKDALHQSQESSCRSEARAKLARLAAKRIDLFIESEGAR